MTGQRSRPTVVDLFAGAGGLSLGFEQAGFDVICAVELDENHANTHAFNFPECPVIRSDISDLGGPQIRARIRKSRIGTEKGIPKVDVVVGGPPCQGFSEIGTRTAGDGRNALIFEFARVVAELRPKYFVMENVPGLLFGRFAEQVQHLMEMFAAAGYVVPSGPVVLDAADYGVPQRRRRLFLIGHRKDQRLPLIPPRMVWPVDVAEGVGESLPLGPTVWDAIGDLGIVDMQDDPAGANELVLTEAQRERLETDASDYVRKLRGTTVDSGDLSYGRLWDRCLLTNVALTEHSATSRLRFAMTAQGHSEGVSRFHRPHANGLANTIRAGTSKEHGGHTAARPIHPCYPRVLSVREAARLHSYPDWFRFHRTRWRGFQQVGNSVPPLLARAVAAQIALAMEPIAQVRPAKVMSLGDVATLGGDRVFGNQLSDLRPRVAAGA